MQVQKAVITAAGKRHRKLPLQTLSDADGDACFALHHLLREVESAGIEEVALVVHPQDRELYAEAVSPSSRVEFVCQDEQRGFGHAVSCARDFVGKEPFLLLVSDHIYLSDDPERSCARQLIEIAQQHDCAVSAVQATHESELMSFGAVGGRLYENTGGCYSVERVIEKPTPTLAEQQLQVPGLRNAYYLCFFGMHVLTPQVFELIDQCLQKESSCSLSEALALLAEKERYLALELKGRRYDMEAPHGLLMAQLAVALSGRKREEVLSQMVQLLARQS
jgi:UTP--glucose-1-phosphate uridylyltransferase